MNFIVCQFANGDETWINCIEIAAMHDYSEDMCNYTRIYLKSGKELVVEDTVADIFEKIRSVNMAATAFIVGETNI